MTALITLENTDNINKKVKVGEEILKMYGSNIYLEVGEEITIKDLLYGMLLRSGNDAATVLAKITFNDENKFVEEMNKKAKEIGMKDTVFKNPTGLDEDTKNISTALDMAKLSRYIYNNYEVYRIISATKKYQTNTKKKTYIWFNRNELLSKYKYATGGKTGYTPKAGRTLVTTATKNNLNLTIVSLDDDNFYDTHEYLYEMCFKKYKNYKILDKKRFTVSKKIFNEDVYIKRSFSYPLTILEKEEVNMIIQIDKKKRYKNNEQVGVVIIKLKEKVLKKIPIYINKKKRFHLF